MDGTGHRAFAPVFTACSSALLIKAGMFGDVQDPVLTGSLMSLASIASARWCDADLLALKPTPIITGTAKKRMSAKYKKELYYVRVSGSEFKRQYGVKYDPKNPTKKLKDKKHEAGKNGSVYFYYESCKRENPIMLAWAFLFKAMKLKKHRGWQSHSPLLWFPIWLLIIYCSTLLPNILSTGGFLAIILLTLGVIFLEVTKKKKLKITGLVVICGAIALVLVIKLLPTLTIYFPYIVASLGLGYLSHIAGDMFTQEGAPILADNKLTRFLKKIPIIKYLIITELKPVNFRIGKFKFKINFAKASNSWYPYLLMAFFICITFIILDPVQALSTFKNISLFLFDILKVIFGIIKYLFTWIYSMLKG